MRFGREMDDHVRGILPQKATETLGIAEIEFLDRETRIGVHFLQIAPISTIGEPVHHRHSVAGVMRKAMPDEIGTDEPGAPRHQHVTHHHTR